MTEYGCSNPFDYRKNVVKKAFQEMGINIAELNRYISDLVTDTQFTKNGIFHVPSLLALIKDDTSDNKWPGRFIDKLEKHEDNAYGLEPLIVSMEQFYAEKEQISPEKKVDAEVLDMIVLTYTALNQEFGISEENISDLTDNGQLICYEGGFYKTGKHSKVRLLREPHVYLKSLVALSQQSYGDYAGRVLEMVQNHFEPDNRKKVSISQPKPAGIKDGNYGSLLIAAKFFLVCNNLEEIMAQQLALKREEIDLSKNAQQASGMNSECEARLTKATTQYLADKRKWGKTKTELDNANAELKKKIITTQVQNMSMNRKITQLLEANQRLEDQLANPYPVSDDIDEKDDLEAAHQKVVDEGDLIDEFNNGRLRPEEL